MSSPSPTGKRAGFYYGWVIVALSFLTLAFHVMSRFSFSIFYVAMLEEYGWSRGLLAGAYSLGMFTYALASPFMGVALDRVGPRRLFPLASAVLGGGLLAMGFTAHLAWVYFFVGMVMPLGLSASGFGNHSAIMPRWFERRRGQATGIALAGIGVGLLLLAPTLQRLIEAYGWRRTYLLYGLAVTLLILPLNLLFMRDRPEDLGLGRDGLVPSPAPSGAAPRPAERPAGLVRNFLALRRDRRFWFLLFLVFAIGLSNNLVLVHMVAYLVDAGFPKLLAAFVFGLVGVIRTGGSVLGGLVSDLLGRQRAAALASLFVAGGVSLLMGLAVLPHPYAYLFALVFGVGFGAMSTCYAATVGDFFQGANLGTIMGTLEVFYGLGGVLGPWLAGSLFDWTGSYQLSFGGVILLMLAVAALCLRMAPRGAPAAAPG